ncbi:hypothetical protein AMTRI_Chr09g14230 [Amborella trichopoda]|uniref:Cupin type-1 domain-containing protein n=1 Tax=Amborella trichopoda TaxID=13333 RepID=U5D4Q8_AMBTC|nr:11S globulin seed storage protein 2 [Amborella trichopoda]ERN17205.1 hypothetical protein AMTR_s00044p00162390 [Amborella trichopoda]|eukprot:XP_006855738.1 11S globulin seed storage protein 2 [Amborella trichopoda]
MDLDLSPKLAQKSFSTEGGSYYAWSASELCMLKEAKVGAAKLVLEKNGFALPSYSDSAKVAYVIQGKGRVGFVLPEATSEKVTNIKKGDAIAVPFGAVTWWFNDSEPELAILFLGDTSKAHKLGEFTDFPITGVGSTFNGFSTEFVSRAWDLKEEDVKKLLSSQTERKIIRVNDGVLLPEATSDSSGLAFNCEEATLDVDIKGGGKVVVLTGAQLPLLNEVGLGADLVRIEGVAMCSPGFSSDSAFQVTYILRGSGRVQVVGVDGKRVLEIRVKAGFLFIVPRFFVVSKIADGDGMDWFSIITTPQPVFSHLAGKTSVWKALSPQVLQTAFNVSPDMEKLFRSKRTKDAIFFPPSN